MDHGQPAQTRIYRARPPALRGALLALLLGAAAVLAAHHLIAGQGQPARDGAGAAGGSVEWPSQGQAAIVIGGGRPAVGPDQEPAPIASLAKVMTAYLTLKERPLRGGEGFTLTVTAAQARAVAEDAERGESTVPVEAGEDLTERRLLEALLIPSGNNVARMLADELAGDEADFVERMNAEAEAIGMDDTTYTDPSGFDPGTVSTAADQLRVFRRAMGFEAFRRIVSMRSVTLPVAGTLANFNPLAADGYAGKTGSDSAAGGCLAFFTDATRDGRPRTVVGVVMGQGEGSDTGALLGAAGEAAERLVASLAGGGPDPRGRPGPAKPSTNVGPRWPIPSE